MSLVIKEVGTYLSRICINLLTIKENFGELFEINLFCSNSCNGKHCRNHFIWRLKRNIRYRSRNNVFSFFFQYFLVVRLNQSLFGNILAGFWQFAESICYSIQKL